MAMNGILRRFVPCIINKRFRQKYAASEVQWWKNNKCLTNLQGLGLPTDILIEMKNRLPKNHMKLNLAAEILQECGLEVSVANMTRFGELYTTDLDSIFGSGTSKKVSKSLLKYLEPFPYDPKIPLPSIAAVAKIYKPTTMYQRQPIVDSEIEGDWPYKVEEEKVNSIATEQRRILRQYFAWYLNSNLFIIDKTLYHYDTSRGLRSLRCLRTTLRILEEELELDRNRILRNFFVTCILPSALRDIIDNVKSIGAYNLKVAANMAPKLLLKPRAEIINLEKLFEKYDIPDNGSRYRVHLHTFSFKTIESRLHEVKYGELEPYANHHRIYYLLYKFNRAIKRIRELKARGFQCISLNLLVCSKNLYERHLTQGIDRNFQIQDMCSYLSSKLDIAHDEIELKISRHPMRYYVPLNNVKNSTETLLEQGFSAQLILEVLPLVFYSRQAISDTLDYISSNQELTELGFESGFVLSPDGTRIDKRLQLCFYFLEKPHHFTGEGLLPDRKNQEE